MRQVLIPTVGRVFASGDRIVEVVYDGRHAGATTVTNGASNGPENVAAAFVEAWNRRDPDPLAALLDTDAEFVNVTGLWWHTREEIRKAHAYGMKRIFKESLLTTTDVRVKWLSDEIAVVHARMNLSGQSPVNDIRTPRQRSNVMSLVVRRTTEGWRCASAHNTDVVPGSETNIVDDEGRLRSVTYRDRP